ncbi:hypothetical protein N7495_002809 [Penicillium taxi]|uniref:uncharacterized protein n=1 Tax=Penicillium taxi TaxID=168475 RepID=UPI002545565A|nr:uncharacterized protein N7495_002809 [Penicillium taxi]KAJ5902281.1 hypothetical protein N7495_002809 [Penicillium taxi]
MITGIAHVNLAVPPGTLDQAEEFYAGTLGLTSTPVPVAQEGTIKWFNIGSSGQQIHISHGTTDPVHRRHPCFHIPSREELEKLKQLVYDHHIRGGPAAPMESDKPGEVNSGAKGVEYRPRFFARDFSGNLLEFST